VRLGVCIAFAGLRATVSLKALTSYAVSDIVAQRPPCRALGLVTDYRETGFEAIIPSVRAVDFNVGMSSFTDTKAREESADFVTYFEAGTLWAQQAGSSVDPNNACGLRVGVTYATIQDTEEMPRLRSGGVAAPGAGTCDGDR
jgi:ABC-type amino acid transport substrate-binding protein